MGKKGGWFSAVKKALSPQSKEKKDQKSKSEKNRSSENRSSDAVPSSEPVTAAAPPPPPLPPPRHVEETNRAEVDIDIDNEQNKHAYSVALATAAAAEAAVAAAQAAAEVVRLTAIPRFVGKSKEEIAAIKIQTAFRGYLARRALRALRGLVRLKSLVEGQSVKRQAATTLRCMQTLARVQSQVLQRRIRMSEENQALQRQLQQKHDRELEKLKMGEIWDDSTHSKEKIEANLQTKQEAAMRRERALAYAFTHQQTRLNSKHSNPTFMDPNNPQWGWSWLERWMAGRPWEARSMTEKDLIDHGSVAGELNRAYALRDLLILDDDDNNNNNNNNKSPSGSRKPKSESPKGNGWGPEDDTKSMMSVQSERYNRRHSIAGDDESLASSPAVPSYMASTRSAKAKTKLPSPLGVADEKNLTSYPKQTFGSAKKRLSYPTEALPLKQNNKLRPPN